MLAQNVKIGFGLIPDPIPHRKLYNGFHLHSAFTAETYPDSHSLEKFTPPRWNQGNTGSCGGHGTAGCITTTYNALGMYLPSPVSPRSVYQTALCVDREPDATGKLPKLRDEGTYPNAIVRALNLWGFNFSNEVDGGRQADAPDYTSYLEKHVTDEPLFGELEDREPRIISSVNALVESGSQKIPQACLAISQGFAIMGAIAAGNDKFMGFSGEGVLDFTGVNIDHWIFFDAYRTNSKGEKEFHLVNSWGLGIWTPDGCVWVTQRFFQDGVFSPLIINPEV